MSMPSFPPVPTRVTVPPIQRIDPLRLAAAFRPITQAMAHLQDQARQLVERMMAHQRRVRERLNDPVRVAGLEARFRVRAALDPAYADPEAIRWLVTRIMSDEVPELALLSRENRALVAAAALGSWVEHHPDTEVRVLAWHRLLGSVPVVVTRG